MSGVGEPAGEVLRLNPNCCYEACAGCSSLAKLRDFQVRYRGDWGQRVSGPPPLLRTVLLPAETASSPESRPCEECGAFDALDFGHVWLCPDCHATRAATCCCDRECG